MNDLTRLAEEVVARRNELGLRQIDIPGRGGPSLDRVQAIEAASAGENYRPRTFQLLEIALGWAPGSVQSILDGGGPSVAHPAAANRSAGVATDDDQQLVLTALEQGRSRAVALSDDKATAYGYLLAVVDTVIQQLRTGGAS
jgi:hypothetical protein